MVLTDLFANPLHPSIEDEWPYIAKVLLHGKERTLCVKSRDHLSRRFSELNRGESCPSPEEIIVMIGNFPEILVDE